MRHSWTAGVRTFGWGVAAALAACSQDLTEVGEPPELLAAKGGNGGGGSAVTVAGADPNWSPQDTTVTVRVLGSGFDQGSRAEWAINGTVVDPSVVRTNSTAFVSAGELEANITISGSAPAVLYDIAVTTSGGRKASAPRSSRWRRREHQSAVHESS